MMTFTANPQISHASRPTRTSLASLLPLVFAIKKQRDALRNLDDSALRDLGLTRKQADVESRRPFWDVPTDWRS